MFNCFWKARLLGLVAAAEVDVRDLRLQVLVALAAAFQSWQNA